MLKNLKNSIYNVRVQIATAFNNGYDHHLIFKGLNEPRMIGMTHEWWYDVNNDTCKESALVLNEFQRVIHKAIRETGGNNAKIFIFHMYAPYDFAMNINMSLNEFIPVYRAELYDKFTTFYKK